MNWWRLFSSTNKNPVKMSIQAYIPFVETIEGNVVELSLGSCAYLSHRVPRELGKSYLMTKIVGNVVPVGEEGVVVIARYSEHGLERCYSIVGVVGNESEVQRVYDEWKAKSQRTDPELETLIIRLVG
jgi:hypothetical protein